MRILRDEYYLAAVSSEPKNQPRFYDVLPRVALRHGFKISSHGELPGLNAGIFKVDRDVPEEVMVKILARSAEVVGTLGILVSPKESDAGQDILPDNITGQNREEARARLLENMRQHIIFEYEAL